MASTSRDNIGEVERWDKYFQPGKPYLDGYRADFMTGAAVMAGYKTGHIAAEFRGITPVQRDELVEALGDRVEVSESPWLSNLLVVLQYASVRRSTMRGCGARCRSRSTAGARRQSCRTRPSSNMSAVSMRPGSSMATPEAELVTIPGFSRDIAASRDEARRLLAEAGIHDLKLTVMVRDIPMPHYAGADLLAESWREIGVATTQDRRNIWDWQKVIDSGDFDVALDFSGDFYDDPTIQLTKFVSHDLSPVNYSGSTDRFLDALFIGQAVTSDSAAAGENRARFRAPRLDRGLYGSRSCGGTGSSQPRRS